MPSRVPRLNVRGTAISAAKISAAAFSAAAISAAAISAASGRSAVDESAVDGAAAAKRASSSQELHQSRSQRCKPKSSHSLSARASIAIRELQFAASPVTACESHSRHSAVPESTVLARNPCAGAVLGDRPEAGSRPSGAVVRRRIAGFEVGGRWRFLGPSCDGQNCDGQNCDGKADGWQEDRESKHAAFTSACVFATDGGAHSRSAVSGRVPVRAGLQAVRYTRGFHEFAARQ